MAKMRRKRAITKWVLFAIALIIVAVELFPIFIIISSGFKRDLDIRNTNPFSFNPNLTSYERVLGKSDFLPSIKNSLIVGLSSTAISLLVGAMASYGISRFRFKGRKVVSYSFLVSRMVPQIALAVPLFMLFDSLAMTDSYISLILAYTSFNIPYVIWLLLPFFCSISYSFEEAARVDGCNRIQIFWKIFLPLTAPGLMVAAIFAFIMSWNEFIYALVLTGNSTKTAPISVNGFLGQYAPRWGQLAAAGTIILIPVIIFTLALQKYIIGGLTAGGVKE
jgi:multiple sugar transport system permease protein